MNTNDDGSTARLNIYNIWGNDVEDIDPNQAIIDYIEVTFTISGLGSKSCNVNEDGSDADPYVMNLVGTIGENEFWEAGAAGTVNITGDGQYTVRTDIATPADTVLCLVLSSNINFYQLKDGVTSIADSGLNITVDSIKTGDEGGSEGGDTTTTTTGTGDGSTTTTTTKKNNSGSSSNSSSNKTTSTVSKTADAGVVAIVVGAAAAASLAAGALTIRKKRK